MSTVIIKTFSRASVQAKLTFLIVIIAHFQNGINFNTYTSSNLWSALSLSLIEREKMHIVQNKV